MTKPRIAAFALLTACAGVVATVAVAPAASAAATGRAPVRVHLTKQHTIAAPATTQPGIVKLHNSGDGELLVATARHHHSARDLARDFTRAGTRAGSARLQRDFSFAGILAPHKNLYTRLHRGRVFIVQVGGSAADEHAIGTIRVTGARRDVALPKSPVRLDGNNTLSVPGSVTHHGLLRVTNVSRSVDVLLVIRIGDHVAQSGVDAFVAHPSEDGLDALEPRGEHFLGVSLPQQVSWLEYRLYPGRYLVIAIGSDTVKLFRAGAVRALVVR